DLYAYVDSNQGPVREMIELLEENFSPTKPDKDAYSLEIVSGIRGSKLSHPHGTHFTFVLQSLHLWHQITQDMFRFWTLSSGSSDMFRLWILAEGDLLGEDNSYRLMNTGQGMNRVQGDLLGEDNSYRLMNTGQGMNRVHGDLLGEDNSYLLMNTGQGMNRVQAAPQIGNAMHRILSRVQSQIQFPDYS
ncbi:hypothetical protein T484DRAFT_1853884, partial [Baffinella frigidus]